MSTLRRFTLELRSTGETDVVDLTERVADCVRRSGVVDGDVLVFAPGATAGITTLEFESGAIADLKAAIERWAPRDVDYAHDRRWGDGNGYSHVRAALIGPSLAVPVIDGRPALGTWQQIVLCDFDNKPGRSRRLLVQVRGVQETAGEEDRS